MPLSLRLLAFPCAALLFCAAAPVGRPQSATGGYQGVYPEPYREPTESDIVAVLRRVRDHAESQCPPRLENGRASLGSYPVGVLFSGMLAAGQATGDRSFTDFVRRRLDFIGENLPHFAALARTEGVKGNSFRNLLAPSSLDSCGAWGAALVRARQEGVGPDLRPVIDRWAAWVSHGQSRLPDGTLDRAVPQRGSVWGDDMYMSVPFLVQLSRLTGDRRYLDDAARQVLQMSQRLFDWDRGIYAHAWSAVNPDDNPHFYWGRANGWCMLATCDLLDALPENHPARAPVLRLLRRHVQALADLQSGDGRWHQLLDKTDSFLETSCSAMFTYGLAHAVNQGWISAASYGPLAQAGWCGVSAQVGDDGAVRHVCVGTSFAQDAMYYYNRPEHDDPHGYGPVLLAGAEMIRLIHNPRISVREANGAFIYTAR